ncbi:MAG: BTAD domain-containing putative transcriptional regulator [Paracoccaceae bacterium]
MARDLTADDLIALSSDPAFVVDSDQRVSGWNSGAEELLGYSGEEAVGRRCGRVLRAIYPTGEPLCSMLCEGRECFALGRKWGAGSCKIRHRNGRMIRAAISTLVLPPETRTGDGGNAVAVVFLRPAEGTEDDALTEWPIRIYSLGNFGLAIAGKGLNVDSWKRKQAVAVLKCLVGQLGRPVHRERLIEWLWPNCDPELGWKRLKVAVSYLRGKLREGGIRKEVVETVGQSYRLRVDAVWVDADSFESVVAEGWEFLGNENPAEALSRFETAENLYRGDYFEGEPYAEWCAEERERLREIRLELLVGMVQCHAKRGAFLEASRASRTALCNDPCREVFIRSLIENLARLGRPDQARAEFAAWRRALRADYGLEPTEETLRVYRHLVKDRAA